MDLVSQAGILWSASVIHMEWHEVGFPKLLWNSRNKQDGIKSTITVIQTGRNNWPRSGMRLVESQPADAGPIDTRKQSSDQLHATRRNCSPDYMRPLRYRNVNFHRVRNARRVSKHYNSEFLSYANNRTLVLIEYTNYWQSSGRSRWGNTEEENLVLQRIIMTIIIFAIKVSFITRSLEEGYWDWISSEQLLRPLTFY